MNSSIVYITSILVLSLCQISSLSAQILHLEYSTYLGGSGSDGGSDIKLGSGGEIYITGSTNSTDFPSINHYQGHQGDRDAYVLKLDSSGSHLIYCTYLGGNAFDSGYAMDLGPTGEAYVTGYTTSANFPTRNAFQPMIRSEELWNDIFVLKLASSGSDLIYSTYFGGDKREWIGSIALGPGDEIYIAGYTSSTDLPTVNPYQAAYQGGTFDAFVSKFDSSGSVLVYSSYLGGGSIDRALDIAIDTNGEAVITGETLSVNFPTLNAYQASRAGYYDVFITKFQSSGSDLVFSTYFGGDARDTARAVVLGTEGEVYIGGGTSSVDFPTRNPYQAQRDPSSHDIFVSKFDSSGSNLIFSTYLGGNHVEEASDIAINSIGEVYLTGETKSTNFPTMHSMQGLSGLCDAFVSKLTSSGSALIFSTYLGGSSEDAGRGIAVGYGDRIYITGTTDSTDFPTANPYQAENRGGDDIFITKLVLLPPTPSPIPSQSASPTPSPTATAIPSPTVSPVPTASQPPPSATPTVIPPSPSPTPSCGPTVAPEKAIIASGDFDGDGTDDVAIFRKSSALWAVRGITRMYFGRAADSPITGDYDGDDTTEVAVFRPSSGLWVIRSLSRLYFGSGSDLPIPMDYGGEGTDLPGIFRDTTGLWAIRGLTRIYYGKEGDRPVPGDYHGGGTASIAIFRPSTGLWAIQGLPAIPRRYFGRDEDWPIPGDYSGDGTWDIGIFRACSGLWAVQNLTRIYFGRCIDWPRPADYNGDSQDDLGIFRGSSGLWAIKSVSRTYFGRSGDVPVTR